MPVRPFSAVEQKHWRLIQKCSKVMFQMMKLPFPSSIMFCFFLCAASADIMWPITVSEGTAASCTFSQALRRVLSSSSRLISSSGPLSGAWFEFPATVEKNNCERSTLEHVSFKNMQTRYRTPVEGWHWSTSLLRPSRPTNHPSCCCSFTASWLFSCTLVSRSCPKKKSCYELGKMEYNKDL